MNAMRSNASSSKQSRRDFLRVATSYLLGLSGVLGAAAVARFLGYETGPRRQTEFDVGLAADFGLNTRTRLEQVPALLVRDEGGFRALSLICTHLGCTVEDSAEGFSCPCHGSRYDGGGEVRRGPASKPLQELRIEITEDGRLIIHAD
jgi:cytochrome b6-f complex iron-sulfur subunit